MRTASRTTESRMAEQPTTITARKEAIVFSCARRNTLSGRTRDYPNSSEPLRQETLFMQTLAKCLIERILVLGRLFGFNPLKNT